jgi:hypothetical protein
MPNSLTRRCHAPRPRLASLSPDPCDAPSGGGASSKVSVKVEAESPVDQQDTDSGVCVDDNTVRIDYEVWKTLLRSHVQCFENYRTIDEDKQAAVKKKTLRNEHVNTYYKFLTEDFSDMRNQFRDSNAAVNLTLDDLTRKILSFVHETQNDPIKSSEWARRIEEDGPTLEMLDLVEKTLNRHRDVCLKTLNGITEMKRHASRVRDLNREYNTQIREYNQKFNDRKRSFQEFYTVLDKTIESVEPICAICCAALVFGQTTVSLKQNEEAQSDGQEVHCCKALFHKSCIAPMFQTSSIISCPCCRKMVFMGTEFVK